MRITPSTDVKTCRFVPSLFTVNGSLRHGEPCGSIVDVVLGGKSRYGRVIFRYGRVIFQFVLIGDVLTHVILQWCIGTFGHDTNVD